MRWLQTSPWSERDLGDTKPMTVSNRRTCHSLSLRALHRNESGFGRASSESIQSRPVFSRKNKTTSKGNHQFLELGFIEEHLLKQKVLCFCVNGSAARSKVF